MSFHTSPSPAPDHTDADCQATPYLPVRRPRQRPCLWCGRKFAVERRPGRQRIYCRTSCRQRAYERRRGLGVIPPPERLITRPGGPLAHVPGRHLCYEAAGSSFLPGHRLHALRPAGIAEHGERRVTLCGLLRAPNGRPFVPGRHDGVCQTCAALAQYRPPRRPMRPSSELAAYRAQLDDVGLRLADAARRRPATDLLTLKAALLEELLATA